MSYYYTKQGYALLQKDSTVEEHWFGGESYHEGAQCPVCKIPLLLIADLSCGPFRESEQARLFHELERIPLYYCWRCCAENLSYRIINQGVIEVFRNDGTPQGNDFPYDKFPEHFPRKPLAVVPIPYRIATLLAIYQEVDDKWLSAKDHQALFDGLRNLRHDGFFSRDVNRHQIGGLPNLIQGHENVGCPNRQCKEYKSSIEGCGTPMKELAVIPDDPHSGLPMVESIDEFKRSSSFNEWVQLVYWVCEECLTIAVSNRCD